LFRSWTWACYASTRTRSRRGSQPRGRPPHGRSPRPLFPTTDVVSTAVEVTGDNTATLTGDLTLIGVAQPVTLDVFFNGESPLPWDANALKSGFSATGSFNPGGFGMTKVAEFGLGPNVSLMFDVEAFKR
jgi:polyisoprenoid-binding protein YceI